MTILYIILFIILFILIWIIFYGIRTNSKFIAYLDKETDQIGHKAGQAYHIAVSTQNELDELKEKNKLK